MDGPRTFTFLGTGTSVGVPMIGCDCAVCQSTDPRNHRYRSSVLINAPGGRLLIDTSPELRLQLLRAKAPFVHAVLYTHYHVDHLFGLDEARLFPRHLDGPLPLYCTEEVETVVRRVFSYAFADELVNQPIGWVPKLVFRRIHSEPFEALGERITPIPFAHGRYHVLGFRIGDLAYCTDISAVPESSWPLLEGLDTLIVSALRFKPHPAHLSLDQAFELIARVKPKRAYLTHMAHELEYEATRKLAPANVEPAYDGLSFTF